jgi:hypothetical protein
MKRTIVMAALGAATVLLAGCSSTSGPASAGSASTSPSSIARTSSGLAAAQPTTGSTSSSTGSTISTDTSSMSNAPATTYGATTGGLDTQSTAWLSTYCTGLAPIADVAKDIDGVSSADKGKQQATAANLYQTFGASFTSTAEHLTSQPAPTFTGGEEYASKIVEIFESAGPAFTAKAKQISAIDAEANPAALQAAIDNVSSELGARTGPIAQLDGMQLTPQTAAAFRAVPACAKLGGKATG